MNAAGKKNYRELTTWKRDDKWALCRKLAYQFESADVQGLKPRELRELLAEYDSLRSLFGALLKLAIAYEQRQETMNSVVNRSLIKRAKSALEIAKSPKKLRVPPISVRYTKARVESGICRDCGKGPLETAIYCAVCAEKERTRTRNYHRKRKGIPLDAPISTVYGRKRGKLVKKR